MKTLPLIVVLLVFVAAGENNQKDALEVPPERVADTYAVYDAALHNPLVGDHQGEPKAYFISDRTGDTYGQEDPEKCIDAPADDLHALEQATSDFQEQKGKVYRLENRFNLGARKVKLLNKNEEGRVEEWLFNGQTRPEPPLDEATDIIRLSNVGFSGDRLLAIVTVSNYCGGLCGSERWRIFKRTKDGWTEQPWNRCVTVS